MIELILVPGSPGVDDLNVTDLASGGLKESVEKPPGEIPPEDVPPGETDLPGLRPNSPNKPAGQVQILVCHKNYILL